MGKVREYLISISVPIARAVLLPMWSWAIGKLPSWIQVGITHLYRTSKEFLFILVFSFMPVWLGAILQYLINKNVGAYLHGYLYNGEALLLSATTVGPLMFILINSEGGHRDVDRGFPLKWLYMLIVMVICVVAAAMIGLNAAHTEKSATSPSAMWTLSLIASIASVVVWFLVIVTNSVRESGAADVMRSDEQNFLRQYGV